MKNKTKKLKCKFVKICVRLYSFFEKNWQIGMLFLLGVLFWGPFFWGPVFFWVDGKQAFREMSENELSCREFFKAYLPSLICWALTFLVCWVNWNQKLKEYKKKHKGTKKYDYVHDYGSPREYWRAIDDLKSNIIMSAIMFFFMVICIVLIICLHFIKY